MSNLRHYYLEDLKVLSARTGTDTFNLPESGWLVALIARLTVTNAASDSRFLHPHDGVTKLEVIADGGEVIKSLDGRLAKGINHLDGIKFPRDVIVQGNAMVQEESFYLLFGGSLEDMEYGLDLGKHTNPQLKVTWDGSLTSIENTEATVAWHASTFPKLSIICVFLEAAPGSPRGFVRSQYTTYTPAQSATKEIEIPRGNPLRRVVLRNFYAGSDEEDVFNRVKMDINRGGYTPYDLRYDDLIALNAALYGLAYYTGRLYYTSQQRDDGHVSDYMTNHPLIRSDECSMFYIQSRYGGQVRWRLEHIAGTNYTSATNVSFSVEGPGLHHCLALPFDRPGGLANAYPTKEPVSDVRLKITSASGAQTSSKAYVLWEDVVPY